MMTNNLFLFFFCTALLVTFITDYLYLLIYLPATIFLIPIFLIGAHLSLTPITLYESLLSVIVGYGFLWVFKTGYAAFRGIDGIGQGDLELLAMVGSYLGYMGVFYTVTFGSVIGTLCALALILFKKADAQTALPFGSFLAIGSLIYLFIGAF